MHPEEAIEQATDVLELYFKVPSRRGLKTAVGACLAFSLSLSRLYRLFAAPQLFYSVMSFVSRQPWLMGRRVHISDLEGVVPT